MVYLYYKHFVLPWYFKIKYVSIILFKVKAQTKNIFPLVISGFIYMILMVLVARSVLISTFDHDTDKLIFSKINDFKQSCDEFSKKAFEVGCDDFISKPLTKKLVLFKIGKLINSIRP